MPQNSDKGSGFEKLRLLGSFVLSFVLILGTYYFFYVQKKSSYLMSRNFRFLAAIGTQLSESVESQGSVLKHLGRSDRFVEHLRLDPDDAAVELKERQYRRKILTSLAFLFDRVGVKEPTDDFLPYRLQPEVEGYWLECAQKVPDPTRRGKEIVLHGRIALAKLLDPLFRSSPAFESLLLADAQGRVFYQNGAADLSTASLEDLVGSDDEKGSRRAGREDERKKGSAEGRQLFTSSDFRDVRLSGRQYRLFVEPVSLPIEGPASRGVTGGRHVWLICGLAPKRELFYKSFAVSSALVSFILGLLVLAILSWPFVKLSLLGNRQRVHIFDVLLLGICSVLGISILTLFLCNLFAYRDLQTASQRHLRAFSETINQNLAQEVAQAYRQIRDLEAEGHREPIAHKEEEEPDALDHAEFKSYPFSETFMVLDDQGLQKRKWATGSVATPLIQVASRAYFRRSLEGETWGPSVRPDEESLGPFVLQSTVGLTDGSRAGVISKPAEGLGADYKVSALAIPMISLINPVLPPGFEFAVIDNDDEGRVLFHSDPRRNLTENLFEETDQNRRLRAAVFARRSETLDIRYLGEDYLARVTPVKDMPWTVVAMRDKRTLRAVNVDWMSTATLFIVLYVGAIALTLALVAVIFPHLRIPWVWPDPRRAREYLQLAAAYGLLSAAFVWIIRRSPGGQDLLWAGLLIPVVAWAVAYLRLGRAGRRKPAVAVLGFLCLLLLFRAVLETAGACALLVAGCGLALLPLEGGARWGRGWQRLLRDRVLTTRSYPAAGVLLLALTAVLPTWSFFKVAHQVQIENLVKHGQLKIMMALQQRDARVRREFRAARGLRKDCLLADRLAVPSREGPFDGLDIYARPFFGTQVLLARAPVTISQECRDWRLAQGLPPLSGRMEHRARCCPSCREDQRRILSESLEDILPSSSEYAREMRELLHDDASDGAWHWHRWQDRLALCVRDYPGGGQLRLVSDLNGPADGAAPGAGLRMAGLAFPGEADFSRRWPALIVLLLIVFAIVRFIARKVFLFDVLEPLWAVREGDLPAMVGSNLFLISRQEKWPLDRGKFFRLHCKDLEGDRSVWADRRLDLVRSLPDRNILVEGFEYRIADQSFNEVKLAFLEELLEKGQRTLVVLSTVSPIAQERPRESRRTGEALRIGANLKERWQTLLASFALIDLDLRTPNGDVCRDLGTSRIGNSLLRQESGGDPFLQQIAGELDAQAAQMDRDQLLEEFGERAESRYRSIWASCSRDEQVVLEHLAEEGFVNEKNRRLVRRLMARGLIQRAPNFRLFNETFRRFVASATCRSAVLDLERRAEPSAWDRFRWPFFIGLSATFAFFFATQQALLEGTLATVSGVAAGLPALVKLLDFFSSGRGSGRTEISR